MAINMNDMVRLRLTPAGRAAHRAAWEIIQIQLKSKTGERSGRAYMPPIEEQDGTSYWTFFQVMRLFGPFVVPDAEPPFTNLEYVPL
jgi:hypothetical protein